VVKTLKKWKKKKNVLNWLILIVFVFSIISCETKEVNSIDMVSNLNRTDQLSSTKNGFNPTPSILPSNLCNEILNYVSLHFPNSSILKVEKEIGKNSRVTYEVDLTGKIELVFNNNCSIIDIETDNKALPNSVIPKSLKDYVILNYPNNFITGWKLESNYQEIELNNGVGLEFNLNGTFIRVDKGTNSSSNATTSILPSNLCIEILNYVSLHFPNSSIFKVKKEIGKNNSVTYELDLTGNVDLVFNNNCSIIDIESDNTAVPNSVVPKSLKDYVILNYPNNFITGWELKSNYQEIELNNGIGLEFNLNGTFIRVDPE